MPKSLFESICAMLNREGGDIMLGLNDNNEIVGVNVARIDGIVKDIVNQSNNPQKLEPPFILYPEVYQIGDKWLIHIQVPRSSQVHKSANILFNRSHDGDYKVTGSQQIAALYFSKRIHYSENHIYPYLRFEDFNESLFP
jgi:ATP-dependent DNA helicase RecG